MPFTSGLIHNDLPTPSSGVVINARNITSTTALVLIEVYVVPPSTNTLTLIYLTGYMLPGKSSDSRQFNIEGNIAYEIQVNASGVLSEVAFTAFGVDEFGLPVDGQQMLAMDWQEITAFSTTP
ncbi:hypothetical protein [Paenibacillus sp. CF384]|uniref:hypothetical protein n=1 Tax=Paenibacillus sp. CF384 TaxID=1884382 RepID=UPI0008945DC4|nr:hypothetical protein [Paenibacillus sp. CF384]SDW69251.1 hypothetical protein SAMN05518855_1004164 [Paenibacillus sp. CF384]